MNAGEETTSESIDPSEAGIQTENAAVRQRADSTTAIGHAVPLGIGLPLPDQPVMGIPAPRQTRVDIDGDWQHGEDPYWNAYWGWFFLGIIMFPIPVCVFGAFGIGSQKRNEKMAGWANLMGLVGGTLLLAVIVAVSYI